MRIQFKILLFSFLAILALVPSGCAYDLDEGLIAYYSFDDGTARDNSGNGHDGVIHGATVVDGVKGKALYFDGVNDYVEIPDDNSLETEGEKTVVLWVKPADNTTHNVPISKYKSDTPTEDGWIISFSFNETSKIRAWIKNSENAVFHAPNIPYEANKWYHVAMTWNTNGGVVKLYINGEYIGSSERIYGTFNGNPRSVIIGDSYCKGGYLSPYCWFHGIIDEVRIYNRTLSEEEIKALYGCRGTCYSDEGCGNIIAENIPCYECIALGGYWKPNKDSACFNAGESLDLCLAFCPQCCNGIDDDFDGLTDYPADEQCTCGLDPSEENPLPPIPEAVTILLVGVGIAVVLKRL